MNNLTDLKMNNCFVQEDFQHFEEFPEVFQLERLQLKKVGLLTMGGLKERTPLLEVLNLAENKIRDLDVIDEVAKLDNL